MSVKRESSLKEILHYPEVMFTRTFRYSVQELKIRFPIIK